MYKIVLLFLFISVVLSEDSAKVRVKRGKYYSSSPTRFYRQPPPPHVVKGPFSYTPPPFMTHDPYKSKVSKRPNNDGLADKDINNLVRHLSKKDLDKIIEFAGEKDRYFEKTRDDSAEYSKPFKRMIYRDDEPKVENSFVKDEDERLYRIEYSEPLNYVTAKPKIYATPPSYPEFLDKNPNFNTNDVIYNSPESTKVVYVNTRENQFPEPELIKTKVVYVNQASPQIPDTKIVYTNAQSRPDPNTYINPNAKYINAFSSDTIYSNAQLQTDESMFSKYSYVTPPTNYLFTNSSIMNEEVLPRPVNLREEQDYEVSYTNNVPTVVNADSYKVESFKDLPLMNYHNSKLHNVDSYKVPHYTVTSTKSQQIPQPSQRSSYSKPTYSSSSSSSEPKGVPFERAPSGYTGQDQSDAHLKAIKIWTHHSTGTAYTLHDDGTLSVEKPRFKTSYGYA